MKAIIVILVMLFAGAVGGILEDLMPGTGIGTLAMAGILWGAITASS